MDTLGLVSLASTLLTFNNKCTGSMKREFETNAAGHPDLEDVKIHPGMGFNCFAVGAVAAFVRLLLHILTPLPHRGKGIIMPMCKMAGMCVTCKGCCVLYDDEAEEAERRRKHAALHGVQPEGPHQHKQEKDTRALVVDRAPNMDGDFSAATGFNHVAGASAQHHF